MNKKKNNKGFSLIELIIAIAILIILTGLLAPQFMKYIEKSREAKDMQAMDTVYSSVQAALANEAAYDAMVELTDGDKIYKGTLTDVLKDTSSFGVELKGLLGNAALGLKSKKATSEGEICIAIEYNQGKETIKVPNEEGTGEEDKIVDVFAGFSVAVYCGNGTAAGVGDLTIIGDPSIVTMKTGS